jgi:hypothetical protein
MYGGETWAVDEQTPGSSGRAVCTVYGGSYCTGQENDRRRKGAVENEDVGQPIALKEEKWARTPAEDTM